MHFIPAFIYLTLVTLPAMYYFLTKEFLFDYLIFLDTHDHFLSLLILSPFIYAILALREHAYFRKIVKQNYSNLDQKDLEWVRHMLIGIIIVCSLDITTTIYEFIFEVLDWESGFLTVIALAVLSAYLGYYGLSQSSILVPEFLLSPKITNESSQSESSFSPTAQELEEFEKMKQALSQSLSEKKAFLDPDLTLGKLSSMIGCSDKKLSLLLNQILHTSFYQLINEHRVDEVKKMIDSGDYDNYTLLGIAQEAGFKSKTSFNRIFKKTTSFSPSEYKKRPKT